MRFDWDGSKAKRNLAKHGIALGAAAQIFVDPDLIETQDRFVEGEERWQAIEVPLRGEPLLLVAYTTYEEDEETIIRIISARKAGPKDARRYFARGS